MWGITYGHEILIMTIDLKKFLLVILNIYCFGSPLGEIVGSYSTEEEAARYPADHAWVPAVLDMLLESSFVFPFLIFSHQNPSLVAGTLASASGPLLNLLNVCCDHNCSMYESWKFASKTAEIWSNNKKTHVHMSLESSKRNGIHVDQLHN